MFDECSSLVFVLRVYDVKRWISPKLHDTSLAGL